jgi:hypothetical protein
MSDVTLMCQILYSVFVPCKQNIQRLVGSENVTEDAKIVLVLLYALRYEKAPNNAIKSLIDQLDRYGVSEYKSSVSVPVTSKFNLNGNHAF